MLVTRKQGEDTLSPVFKTPSILFYSKPPNAFAMSTKTNLFLIDCGSESNLVIAYMSMFRYAFGRRTYVPSTIVEIIKRNITSIPTRVFELLDRELEEQAEFYNNMAYTPDLSNYGDANDRTEWLAFHVFVKNVLEERTRNLKSKQIS